MPVRVLAGDERFLYEGRIDCGVAGAPVMIWQGSRIRLDFEGDTLGLFFSEPKGQSFFDVEVDGVVGVIGMREGAAVEPGRISGFGPGRHRLVVFKRSEANAGTVRFDGVELAPGAQAWKPARPAYRVAMEFYGDSITAGACNEDGEADQWEDRRTHNNAKSYAALTAKFFEADYRNIAVSGMGVATGWEQVKAGQIWDRLYPKPGSVRAELSGWRPDVVFVNLGENDDSFTRANGQGFPEGYTPGYVELVRGIRGAYPAAQIVLLRGGMYGGARSEPLQKAWEAAVAQLEAGDKGVSYFVFTHWSGPHPRVADDEVLAEELIGWLKRQEFMRGYLRAMAE